MSPLMRALETAAGVFGGGPFEDSGPLMLAQTELEDERAAHGAVACPDALPFIAFEGCRERLGMPLVLAALHLHRNNAHVFRPLLLLCSWAPRHVPVDLATQRVCF